MNVPINVVIAVIVVFGFLTGSSLYFYNKNTADSPKAGQGNAQGFDGEIPSITGSGQAEIVNKNTKPADHRGRVTFPANVYTVSKGETLFSIGSKFQVNWQLIVLANGLENENSIQAGKQLVIPKLSNETDYYRVDFTINEDNASLLNAELRDQPSSDYFDPKLVVKNFAVPYFGISETDQLSILEQDNSRGTALIEAISTEKTNVVGLYQPKQKGDKGFWAILYIEHHE
jgi:LysM repeat protein